jgi:hypothetical protein
MIMLPSMFRTFVFVFLLFVHCGFAQAVECPNGWAEMPPSRCALLVRATVSHLSALSECRRRSSELLAARSQADQDFATMLCGTRPTCWIDIVRDGSGTWVHGDGSNATFTKWAGGEPNDANGGEGCAVIVKSDGGDWADVACFTSHSVLCQIRIDETTTAAQTTAAPTPAPTPAPAQTPKPTPAPSPAPTPSPTTPMPMTSSSAATTATATSETAAATTGSRTAVPESTATVTSTLSAKSSTETIAASTTMTPSSWSPTESAVLTTDDKFTIDGASGGEPSGAAWVLPTAIVVALALALCGLAALLFFFAKKRSTRESLAAGPPLHGVELSANANQYASLPLRGLAVAPLPAPHHYDSPTSKLAF